MNGLVWLTGMLAALLASATALRGDWPMIRGDARHSGFAGGSLATNLSVAWAREFVNERIGTAAEPIVARGRVLAATHAGVLHALDAVTGEPRWKFGPVGAFLNSPAVADGRVLAASADGFLYALELESGKLEWRQEIGLGGAAAAPIPGGDSVFVASRRGDVMRLSLADGKPKWRRSLRIPVRQTPALDAGSLFLVAEDLRARCMDAANGEVLWTADPVWGQTARDYYPITLSSRGGKLVIFRTNPVLNMGQRIGRDRTLLCRNAGVDDSSWQRVDAWLKSDGARGTPELWAREQETVRQYLEANPDAQSFFVLDAKSGKRVMTPPILWVGGCQSVGAQPALTGDGRLLVFYRSAYGNWNHGVAPLVALGLWNPEDNRIVPLAHQQGRQPQWNCFWGTADESQNFLVVGNTALLIHQGTLSRLEFGPETGGLRNCRLSSIAGERDTFGGFRNPSWARNEWHGPGRSGVAVDSGRVYWQTGSRVLCLGPGVAGAASAQASPAVAGNPMPEAGIEAAALLAGLRERLCESVAELLSTNYGPLFCDPGLSGRVFAFDRSPELFEALAWAYPHLSSELRDRVRAHLRKEWETRPPFSAASAIDLKTGAPREWFAVPAEYRSRLGTDPAPHPFGGLWAAEFYGHRCGEGERVREAWPAIRAACRDFLKRDWVLSPEKGDLFANRYLASLLAAERMAGAAGEPELAGEARAKAEQTRAALVAWWRRAARQGALRTFNGAAELDPYIGRGGGFLLALAPHRHALGLFRELTPELANSLRAEITTELRTVWADFGFLCPTWHLVGEERQVHFGENFVDPPVFAMDAFRAAAWIGGSGPEALAARADLPACRGDLYHITKLSIALETPGTASTSGRR